MKPPTRKRIEVSIILDPSFKEEIGTEMIKMQLDSDETMDSLVMKLGRRYPRLVEIMIDPTTGEISEKYRILLNGRRIRGIHTKLKHKDEISVLPPEQPQESYPAGEAQPQA
ncbi:MAG: MoaD/ThiS family protein [Candidatus Hadarchaeales archaeon]